MATPRWITAAEVTQDEAGDVQGPDSSVDGNIALFDGTTGKLLKAAGVVEGVATIDATTNILIGDDAGNAIDSTVPISAISGIPLTLNPGDVLAQDGSDNPLISLPGDGSQLILHIPSAPSSYIEIHDEDDNALLSLPAYSDIHISAAPGNAEQPQGNYVSIVASDGYDDGAMTPTAGGGITLQVGNPSNDGNPGVIELAGPVVLSDTDHVPSAADDPALAAGQIAWDSDYIYVCVSRTFEGVSTWKRAALTTWP